jgi:hypothetical protein
VSPRIAVFGRRLAVDGHGAFVRRAQRQDVAAVA